MKKPLILKRFRGILQSDDARTTRPHRIRAAAALVNPQQVLPRAKISLEAKALRDLLANTKGQLARRNDSSCPVTTWVTLSDNSIGES